ncbi:adenosine deaminase [Clostridiales bacterium 1_7_47FAA]|uniref:adenosine deaminase n=1 Tax=Enterocloster hominis (ex Hitch et al. 2024) TaxID=1917870 RepID=A0ABV1DCZ5_9FIRM|nr:adenosine deaminase [Clostridiales bacterium 1_7_47FAA]
MWIDSIPKVELHCHLDGSIPADVLLQLCRKGMVRVPQAREDFLKLVRADEECGSLADYLKSFEIPLRCLKSEEAFYQAAYHTACAASGENVRYMEIRFAPLLSASDALPAQAVIEAVAAGLSRARTETGIICAILLCGMRQFTDEMNLKNLELAKAYLGKGVAGVDLAGDEAAYPNELFREYFARAGEAGIPFTIHSGECGRARNIELAVEYGAARVGHGIAMRGNPRLQELCREKHVGVEMCPKSNLQTGAVAGIGEYPLREFLDNGLLVSLNTDNRTVTGTTVSQELGLMEEHFRLTKEEGKAVMKNAIRTSFADQWTKEKIAREIDSWE